MSIEQLRAEYQSALKRLTDAIEENCGWHDPVQHRDMNPPWCRNCGRTDYGLLIKIPGEQQ